MDMSLHPKYARTVISSVSFCWRRFRLFFGVAGCENISLEGTTHTSCFFPCAYIVISDQLPTFTSDKAAKKEEPLENNDVIMIGSDRGEGGRRDHDWLRLLPFYG